jgi:hypothetical protein
MAAGAIAPRRLELQYDVPSAVHTQALVEDRRAGNSTLNRRCREIRRTALGRLLRFTAPMKTAKEG